MSLAILSFALDCEILAEEGHGVPCPYEENPLSWPRSVLSFLEVIVCVHMGRFLLLFD